MNSIALPSQQILLPPLKFPEWVKNLGDPLKMIRGAMGDGGAFPQVMGGAGVAIQTLIFDKFTDTNGTNLASHTIAPTNTPATSWAVQTGAITIQSNKANTSTALDIATCNPNVADCTVSVDVTPAGISYTDGLYLRFTAPSSNSGWMLLLHQIGLLELYEVVSGGVTLRASGVFANSAGNTYTVKAVMVGAVITGYANGTQILTYASATTNKTVGVHGIRCNDSSAHVQFDNFTVTVP